MSETKTTGLAPSSPERAPHRTSGWVTVLFLSAAIVILALSFVLAPRPGGDGEESFGGTDAKVTEMLEKDGAEPWFKPLFKPGSSEIESGLFALQAALGAGGFGYAVGRLHGRRRTPHEVGAGRLDSVAAAPGTPPRS